MIHKHFDKNNLHHAYLIEGLREEVLPEIVNFMEDLGVKTLGNQDFIHIALDSFKIEDARNLKSYTGEKGITSGKKVFVISANNFLLEAQNSMLKMFEEPIENTHFFVIVPDINALLQTFISRFYLIKSKTERDQQNDAEKFIKMPLVKRIEFIKELLTESEEGEDQILQSSRFKAHKFLNNLESSLYSKMPRTVLDTRAFSHIFKVREFLRMPGSSPKTLMESVALVVPYF